MSTLNPRQLEAMKYIDGPLLVLAGAGSGKTSVITRKIAYLIEECGIKPHRIFAVTFTNKAAREMKERVGKLLSGKNAQGISVSTFHTLGLTMIRHELEAAGLKQNFSILDSDDAQRLLADLLHKENSPAADRKEAMKFIIKKISDWKNDLIQPVQAVSVATTNEELIAAQIYEAYQRHLRAYNAVDFDDLIAIPTRLLQENQAIREKWQERVHYLLVDEYQDTNTAQYLLVKLLVGARARFTAVGDDDQSIYAWRGAKPENMIQLTHDYPNLKVVKLEQNYRSMARILTAANSVIGNNPHVFEKKLWSQHGLGDRIRIITCPTDRDEAERVANDLIHHKLINSRTWKDYAILYRGNFQAKAIETQLRELQIPYKISGGQSFYSRAEIKDVMSYLRLIINPSDDSAFLRIINTPKRGIGPTTLEKLASYAQQRGVSLLTACQEFGLAEALGQKKALVTLQEFAQWLEHHTREILETTEPVPEIRKLLNDIDFEDYIREQAPTPQGAEARLENINFLLTSIQGMLNKAESEDDKNIEAVIRKLVLIDLLDQQAEEDDSDRVQLLTLHASKGLEYPHVYIIGLEEDLLPHRNSIDADTVEEERRLMYVGITRAKQTLTLTLAERRKAGGDFRSTMPSRFLDELPHEEIEWIGRTSTRTPQEKQRIGAAHLANLRALLK
ncbi:ATP-dependent DNA helicase Rep [Fluviicoccus keumensis]|uniref:ATP-dependent DNA helicase Rep n=1 Tax=Fluviicoccus keumensis TaxID=1435465 RepID=A0A4Q7ZA53_9GAMM|nr:DNA helicase Rep [Fluviicoccus keumensis]RZU46964.1 ATP-dependent DNA helicase Rep [Fluviicoccus keumensis]